METKKIYAPHELMPSELIHPGEVLKDELQSRGVSQKRFAQIIGMPYTMFNEIVNGKRSITTDTALKIEAATHIKAYIWMNMQVAYNMQVAREDNKLRDTLQHIRKIAAML